jgi:hypothetical protein
MSILRKLKQKQRAGVIVAAVYVALLFYDQQLTRNQEILGAFIKQNKVQRCPLFKKALI